MKSITQRTKRARKRVRCLVAVVFFALVLPSNASLFARPPIHNPRAPIHSPQDAVKIPADVQQGLRQIEQSGGYARSRLELADDPRGR